MNRRAFIAGLGGAAAWPTTLVAQGPTRRPLIAWLSGGSQTFSSTFVESFLRGMREVGYIEGRNFDMTYRFSEGYQDRLPGLAKEVVHLKPDSILAAAVVAAVAARNITSTIPIVCPALADAIQLGLITTEARPGGNVTGIEPYVAGLPAKQLEVAREIVPSATKIGLLTDLKDQKAPPQAKELAEAGRALQMAVVAADASQPDDLEPAFQDLAKQRVDVVIVLQTSMLLSQGRKIADLALARHLATVFGYREHVQVGGLVSYGVDLRWCFHHSASLVDKILHGSKPGDLPVEFPTSVELAINLKTARALGLTIPPAFLARADEVIE
jgi:putative ABC transport system substrate-binding protein